MIKKLFSRTKEDSNNLTLSPAIREAALQAVGSRSIPTMPSAAQKAFQLAIDPNTEARDFIEVIEADEALSARVLKIANSVYYDRGTASTSIEQSVNIIGLTELRCLLNATTLSEIFPSRNPARIQFWANDIATALISRTIAQRIYPKKAETAFLAGLMHDVGKLLMLQRAPTEYEKILSRVKGGESFILAEEDIFVCNHTEVGQIIAERWNFGDELIQVIRQHHEPFPKSYSKTPPLYLIVKAADIIAHYLALGHHSGFGRLQKWGEKDLSQACLNSWNN